MALWTLWRVTALTTWLCPHVDRVPPMCEVILNAEWTPAALSVCIDKIGAGLKHSPEGHHTAFSLIQSFSSFSTAWLMCSIWQQEICSLLQSECSSAFWVIYRPVEVWKLGCKLAAVEVVCTISVCQSRIESSAFWAFTAEKARDNKPSTNTDFLATFFVLAVNPKRKIWSNRMQVGWDWNQT